MANEPIFLFDGDCAFCSSSIRLMTKVVSQHPEIQPYQWIQLNKYGIKKEDCIKAVQFYKNEEKVYSGSQAFAQFLILSNYPWKIIGFLLEFPIVNWISKLLYGFVARNRYRLPGGTPECKLKEIS